MRVSLIIPTLNEIDSIGRVLDSIPREFVDEILIVDGHSTDGTQEVVKKMGYPVILQEGKGFGRGVATGIKYATGDVLIFLTADGSQNPQHIPRLLQKLLEGYDMVLASRYLPDGGSEDDTRLTRFGNKLFTFLCNRVYRSRFSDLLYFFMAVRKKVFDAVQLKSSGFEYCAELPIKTHLAGFKIGEIPSVEQKRREGRKKVKVLRDGWRILMKILKSS